MQKISVVQKNAGVVGELEEASSAALTVRLPDGRQVSVSRDQLEPLPDGTLLLQTPIEKLPLVGAEQGAENAVRAAATIAVQSATTTKASPPPPVPWTEETVNSGESVTVPRVEEQLSVDKHKLVRGTVRVRVVPREREQTVSVPLVETRAEVRRVEVGRIVDAVPPVREEGGCVIIPVVEEVLVVEKRLLLREEVHVLRTETTRNEVQTISLRSEDVEISQSNEE